MSTSSATLALARARLKRPAIEPVLDAILNSSLDCIKLVDLDGTLRFINKPGLRAVGLEAASQVEGRPWAVLLPAEAHQMVEAAIDAGAKGISTRFDAEAPTAQGESRWWDIAVTPIMDGGRTEQLLVISRDITDRVRSERALRDSEENYRRRIELNPAFPWTADAEGRLIEASPRLTDLTGVPYQDLLGDGWLALVHPEDLEAIRSRVADVIAAGAPVDARFRNRVRDGSYRWFRMRGYPDREGSGAIVRWYGTSEDIHEQVLAEKEKQQTEAQFEAIFQQATVGIALVNPGQGIVVANDRLGEILGEDPAALHGRRVLEMSRPVEAEANQRLFDSNVAGRTSFRLERELLRADGTTVLCDIAIAVVRKVDSDAPMAIAIVEDISKRREAETKLHRLQNELAHASRVSAMGAVAGAVAHEVNQPLVAISNFTAGAKLLLGQHGGAAIDDAIAMLDKASASAVDAGQIIRRMRDMVKRGEPEIAATDLSSVIENSLALALPDPQRRSAVVADIEEPGLAAMVDRVQVQQVLVNLVRNAFQAMASSPRKELRISARREGQRVTVAVADTGPGVSEALRGELFTPFATTKADGTGLGLSISRTIIEHHGGKLWLDENAGGGAVFLFTIPAASSAG